MEQTDDLLKPLIPPEPRDLLQCLFLELYEDGDGVVK